MTRPDRPHRAARPAARSRAGPTAPRPSPTTSTPTGSSVRDVPITAHGDDRGRRGHGRPDRVGADGARRAQLHALVHRRPASTRRCARRSRSRSRTRPARSGRSTCSRSRARSCEVVMPGASSMRGVTGFRALDAINGALAQLIPDRVPAAGEGGNTLAIFGAERPGRRARSSSTSSSSAPGAARRSATATTASRTRRASRRTSRSRSPSPSSRS